MPAKRKSPKRASPKRKMPPRPKRKGPAMDRYMAFLRSLRKPGGRGKAKSPKVKKTSPRRVTKKSKKGKKGRK